MKKGKVLLQFFLMFVVALAVIGFIFEGPDYIGKSYYNSDQFSHEEEEFRSGLTKYVLHEISEDVLREELLTVSEEELEHYREYYGTLPEQVQNIMDQYENRLAEASSDEVQNLLRAERDKKIADIKKNFEDDEHTEKKVIALKEKALDEYLTSYKMRKMDFLNQYNYFNYSLKNSETGEAFTKGDITKDVLYKFAYTENDRFSSNQSSHYIYLAEYLNDGEGLLPSERIIVSEPSNYTGTVTISNSAANDVVQSIEAFKTSKIIYYALFGTGIVSFLLLLTVMRPEKKDFDFAHPVQAAITRVPVDVFMIIWLFIAWFTLVLMIGANGSVHAVSYFGARYYDFFNILELLLLVVMSFVLFSVVVVSGIWLYNLIRTEKLALVKRTFSVKLLQTFEKLFLNLTIGMQSLAMLIIFFLAGIGFIVSLMELGLLLIYIPLFVLILLPTLYVFLRRMGYLNEIMAQTKEMAEGRLTGDLVVRGKSPLAHHAENLNALRDGVRSSLTEQAKSERMKTELITNVSHDLRTPLTSIITYTDLLKNQDLTEEERAKYIDILEAKSARLKTLIEDLFEVSKMASGNVELIRAQVDLAQLLQQAIGEHEEDFAAAGLDLRVTIAEQPILASVDGQKWWRAIDNLIVNARKYSLEGTRVYVQLKVELGYVEFTLKNIAKYELQEDATELVERFKRADTSRHTEGSGLGLAIAQSIVDLHGGTMAISVDGDLFKVTVKVPMK